jgi:hypothetical protein
MSNSNQKELDNWSLKHHLAKSSSYVVCHSCIKLSNIKIKINQMCFFFFFLALDGGKFIYHVRSNGSSRSFLTLTTTFQFVVTLRIGPGNCSLIPITWNYWYKLIGMGEAAKRFKHFLAYKLPTYR